MQIVQATQIIATAAHGIIACGMAAQLVQRAVDLGDEIAVIVVLAQAGFGLDSIRALRARAVEIATYAQVH